MVVDLFMQCCFWYCWFLGGTKAIVTCYETQNIYIYMYVCVKQYIAI